MAKRITRQKFLNMIKEHKGRMFTVTWTKKNGHERTANGKLGVKYQRTTGKTMGFNPAERALMPIYEMKSRGYRMVDINTVSNLKFNGEEYTVK